MKKPERKITNRVELKKYRRENRREMTTGERIIWNNVRNHRIGPKIDRQHSILNYIVDFYCAQVGLVIEIDGPAHLTPEAIEYDRFRQKEIEELGYDFIRFTHDEASQTPDLVIDRIKQRITELRAIEGRKWWK